MKKFLNKKVNVFGKAVPVFAFVILGLALTSAALVPYLSNVITGNVIVESPFSAVIAIGIQDEGHMDGVSDVEVNLGTIHGGESVKATAQFRYLGDLDDLEVKEVFTISIDPNSLPSSFSGETITCEDFESIVFDSGNGPVDILGLTDWCSHDSGDDYITITDPSGHNIYDSGEKNTVQTEITFKLAALGDYTMTGQIIPTA